MTAILNLIRVVFGRILAAWLAGLAGWLMMHYGIVLDDTTQKELLEHLLGVILPVFITLYSIFHKVFNKKLNPGDAASSHLAEQESVEADRLKR